jgi:nicotinate-nucleotide pyrophosphorylase (carboxylating)
MSFTPQETSACRTLIAAALQEDLAGVGDVTSQAIIPAALEGRASFVARSAGIVAGLPAAALVCEAVESRLRFEQRAAEGTRIQPGAVLATVSGPMRSILTAERTALNFLQRLSGVASLTRRFVDAVMGLGSKILDTRKTTPGWRLLEKYAVRAGGGHNHRLGLYDGILIKDNHLAALGGGAAAIERAVIAARAHAGPAMPIEIEVDSLEQLERALAARPNIILLDNMTLEQLREAVRRRNAVAPSVLLEASGGVTLDTVSAIAETGVDRISVGALTHSAAALDIALDYGDQSRPTHSG